MEAFAVHTIQRGKSANPRVIAAGSVFDASDTELLHLTPRGAIRKPTRSEIANARFAEAEADLVAGARAAVEAVEAEFGHGPAVADAVAISTKQKKAAADKASADKASADKAAADKASADKASADKAPTPKPADDLTV